MGKKKLNILAIIQARVSSSRLPGKVLKLILGKPMLEYQIERINHSKNIDKLIVATSDGNEDDGIEELCNRIGIFCFRGSLDNVLDRFYSAAEEFKPEHVVRLTGDCPLADPDLIDKLIDFYRKENCDYASNCNPPTLPDGLDAEIFSFDALKTAWQNAKFSSELEHVTPYIRNHPECFTLSSWLNPEDLSHLRWTVDESADFDLVKSIYEQLYSNNTIFKTKDILRHLESNSELSKINDDITRNEGFAQSLRND